MNRSMRLIPNAARAFYSKAVSNAPQFVRKNSTHKNNQRIPSLDKEIKDLINSIKEYEKREVSSRNKAEQMDLRAIVIAKEARLLLLQQKALNAGSGGGGAVNDGGIDSNLVKGGYPFDVVFNKLDKIEVNQSELRANLAEVNEKLKKSTLFRGDNFSWVSFSELNLIQFKWLVENNAYTIHEPTTKAGAVISFAEHKKLLRPPARSLTKSQKNVVKNESYLCMKMTRYLNKIFAVGDDIMVNSEELKWIVTVTEHSENYMKPDFFVTRRGLQSQCTETGSVELRNFRALAENVDVDYQFGKLCNWSVRDCISAVIEFKVKLTPKDFGKMVCYLQHLCRDDESSTYYGMVCDSVDIWLVVCTGGKAIKRKDLKWTDGQSFELIQGFFSKRNAWRTLLDYFCSSFSVKLVNSDAFLGCGASGRVFKVVDAAGVYHALKIVHSTEPTVIAAVQAEISTVQEIKTSGGNTVTIENMALYFDLNHQCATGVGYLMAEVGKIFSAEECRNNKNIATRAFDALHDLHKLRRYHGDPRLPNLINYNNQLIWIDFMRANSTAVDKVDFSLYVIHDFNSLFSSIYGEKPNAKVRALLGQYAKKTDKKLHQALLESFIV